MTGDPAPRLPSCETLGELFTFSFSVLLSVKWGYCITTLQNCDDGSMR